jgi:hypothetical protein
MQELDCLIIHTPKFNNYYKPVGQFTRVNYMPLGLLGIADYLNRNRMKCSVLHQGVEKMNRKSWQLEESLTSVSVPVIALSLHWQAEVSWRIEYFQLKESVRKALDKKNAESFLTLPAT